jgi:hypothetical protein
MAFEIEFEDRQIRCDASQTVVRQKGERGQTEAGERIKKVLRTKRRRDRRMLANAPKKKGEH